MDKATSAAKVKCLEEAPTRRNIKAVIDGPLGSINVINNFDCLADEDLEHVCTANNYMISDKEALLEKLRTLERA